MANIFVAAALILAAVVITVLRVLDHWTARRTNREEAT